MIQFEIECSSHCINPRCIKITSKRKRSIWHGDAGGGFKAHIAVTRIPEEFAE